MIMNFGCFNMGSERNNPNLFLHLCYATRNYYWSKKT